MKCIYCNRESQEQTAVPIASVWGYCICGVLIYSACKHGVIIVDKKQTHQCKYKYDYYV